jgi:ABC-type bacteriocin/lantibiotic exporter with double-glycine peptidase domain
MLFIFVGCTTNPQGIVPSHLAPITSGKIENVHFYPQLAYQCGPASLAGVLNFHGIEVMPDQIAVEIFRPDIGATVTMDMVLYARKKGVSAKWYSGSGNDIRRAIDAGVPLIIMVDFGVANISKYHYMVVIGYDPDGIIANTGKEHEKRIRWKKFLPRWDRANRWTLRIEPMLSDPSNKSE